MRVDCLAGAVQKALRASDLATATRLVVELGDAITDARKMAEKAGQQ